MKRWSMNYVLEAGVAAKDVTASSLDQHAVHRYDVQVHLYQYVL